MGTFQSTGGTFSDYMTDMNRVYYLSTSNATYLTFFSADAFTLATANTTKNWDGELEYSTDAISWITWDGTTALSSSSVNSSTLTATLYLRGTGNTRITGNSDSYRWVLTGANISCTGNIENLLDYQTVARGEHPAMASYCYYYLFYGCTSLISAPELPATTLTSSCYSGMFFNCTSLTTPPALPATTLANWCYEFMFRGCTSLATTPALPATTLTYECYSSMFNNCTSLTVPPVLPATTLAKSCYEDMFLGCTSLATAPALPATTLAERCYYQMFSSCGSLTVAPVLPATTLVKNCYSRMFHYCSSLTSIPQLPAATLADGCYEDMFIDSYRVKLSATQTEEYQIPYRIPSSGTGTAGTDSLKNMFSRTGGTFKSTPDINTTYYLSTSNSIVYPNYLTFSSSDTFTLAVNNSTKNWDGELEYSLDANSWNTWDGTTTLTSSAVDSSALISRLYLRGTGNTYITGYASSTEPGREWELVETTNSGGIYCIGNIENLLDYQTVAQG